jgi:hypothetical protein
MPHDTVRFHTTIAATGPNTTGILVPAEVLERLGGSKRPAVHVTVGTYSYRSTVATRGGQFMVSLSAERRAEAGVAAGDEVEVALRLDDEPREVAVPADLAEALAAAGLTHRFEALARSHRSRHVLAVEGAKTSETRARRVRKVVADLMG